MNNKEFDNIIKSSLETMSYMGQPDWNRMETNINEWEMNENRIMDESFDLMIAEKLSNVDINYHSESWDKLEQKIAHRRSIGRQIVYYQMAGAAVVLLLLALLFQLYPGKSNPFSNDYLVKETVKVPSNSTIVQTNDLGSNTETEVEMGEFISSSKAATTISENNDANEVFRGTEIKATAFSYSRRIDAGITRSGEQSTGQSGNSKVKALTLLGDQEDPSREKPLREKANNLKRAQAKKILSINQLSLRPSFCQAISTADLHLKRDVRSAKNETLAHKSMVNDQNYWLVDLYGQPQYLMLNSPFDEIMNEPGYSRSWMTAGAGLGIGYRLGDLELSAGLEYVRLQYEPRRVEEKLENSGAIIHLASISGNMLTVPVQAKYFFMENQNISLYGSVGFSLRTALSTDYEIHRSEQGLTALIQDLRTNPAYQYTLLSQKEFEAGIIDNSEPSLSLSAGMELAFGLQYQLNENWSLFAEPGFKYDLSREGFGPNHDKINHFSFRAGIKGVLN